jgi:hypothetical protein
MPVPDIADELDQTEYIHPNAEIWIADELNQFSAGNGGTKFPHLYLTSLTLRAGPEIDSADFEFRSGVQVFQDEDRFTANAVLVSQVLGKAIKIKIPDTVNTGDAAKDITWFGIVDTSVREGVSQGVIRFQANGVMILAAQHFIYSSYCVDFYYSREIEVGVGRSFNQDSDEQFGVEGNRSEQMLWPDNFYLFAYEERDRRKWNSWTALEYLLKKHSPKNLLGVASPQWIFDQATLFNPPNKWFEPRVQTHGRSLKQIIDDLVPRSRSLGYWAYYDDVFKMIRLKLFSFAEKTLDLYLPDTGAIVKLPKNPDQVTFDIRDSIWVTDAKLTESTERQYDAVIGRGERLTSTCTLTLKPGDDHFVGSWEMSEEAAFLDGVSTTDKEANAKFRCSDRLSNVYSRFCVSYDWDGKAAPQFVGEPYWAFPAPAVTNGNPLQASYPGPVGQSLSIRTEGLRLLRNLPLKERIDYSDNRIANGDVAAELAAITSQQTGEINNVAPFFFVDTGTNAWCLLDKLSASTEKNADKTTRRHWSVHCSIVSHEPAVLLRVGNGCQSLIAKQRFVPVPDGVYDDNWDPVKQNGISFEKIFGTVCIQAEHLLEVRKEITAVIDARPQRILNFDVKNCRRDYVVPGTVVGVENGELIYSQGGFIRDDRARLETIVNAAAEWYGRKKQAFECSYKQVRRLFEIGTLITQIHGMQLTDQVNTPVTSITYTMGSGNSAGSTRIETGFAEVDFA